MKLLLSDLLFQRLVVLANGCNISFDDCKGHEMRAYPPRCLNQQFFKAEESPLTTAINDCVTNAPVIFEGSEQKLFLIVAPYCT